MKEGMMVEEVKGLLEARITQFEDMVSVNEGLEIDGVEDDKIKVINHKNQGAYLVSVDTIVKTPLHDIVKALETGEFIKLHGVTRIVG